jgi:hypothetical protein
MAYQEETPEYQLTFRRRLDDGLVRGVEGGDQLLYAWAAQTTRSGSRGWLCCKKNSVSETEPTTNLVGRLFSFQSEDFPDELNLPKDIPPSAATSLGLSGSCVEPRSLESSASLHRTIESLGWHWHSPAA